MGLDDIEHVPIGETEGKLWANHGKSSLNGGSHGKIKKKVSIRVQQAMFHYRRVIDPSIDMQNMA